MKYNKISIALKDNREISVYLSPDEARDLLDQFYEVFSGGLTCLLYTSPSPRDVEESRMPSSA